MKVQSASVDPISIFVNSTSHISMKRLPNGLATLVEVPVRLSGLYGGSTVITNGTDRFTELSSAVTPAFRTHTPTR